MADETEHVTTTEARAGSGPQDNKVALFVGIGVTLVIFAVLLALYA
jgi:hypothetical protein